MEDRETLYSTTGMQSPNPHGEKGYWADGLVSSTEKYVEHKKMKMELIA